jgi:8-oxo-dGTP pyrophosphatase MutT (NUDIX family)
MRASPHSKATPDGGEEGALRDTIVASLAHRRPVDGREERSRERTLVAFGRLPHPFDQQANPTHVTGSAIVLGPKGVLLHRHKRLGLWLQPGGHLEPGESPWDAALREGQEETGLDLCWLESAKQGQPPPLAHVDVHDGGRGHTHLDLRYWLKVAGVDDPHPPTGESQDVRWFSWPQAIDVADPGLGGLLRHAAVGRSETAPGPISPAR